MLRDCLKEIGNASGHGQRLLRTPSSSLRLLWDDARCLNVYLIGTAAIAVWLKFAIDGHALAGNPGCGTLELHLSRVPSDKVWRQ